MGQFSGTCPPTAMSERTNHDLHAPHPVDGAEPISGRRAESSPFMERGCSTSPHKNPPLYWPSLQSSSDTTSYRSVALSHSSHTPKTLPHTGKTTAECRWKFLPHILTLYCNILNSECFLFYIYITPQLTNQVVFSFQAEATCQALQCSYYFDRHSFNHVTVRFRNVVTCCRLCLSGCEITLPLDAVITLQSDKSRLRVKGKKLDLLAYM